MHARPSARLPRSAPAARVSILFDCERERELEPPSRFIIRRAHAVRIIPLFAISMRKGTLMRERGVRCADILKLVF